MSYQCPMFDPIKQGMACNCGQCTKWNGKKCKDERKMLNNGKM